MQLRPNNSKVVGTIEALLGPQTRVHLPAILLKVEASYDISEHNAVLPNHTKHRINQRIVVHLGTAEYQRLNQQQTVQLSISEIGGTYKKPNTFRFYVGRDILPF